MKFKIRAPFTVHIESVVEQTDVAGRKQKVGKTDSHFSREEIDISAAEARKHLHKLEPMDDEARSLMAAEHEKNKKVRAAQANPAFAEAVSAAVADALRELGVLPAAAKK